MIKKGDFIKLNYTGKLEDGSIFDTTKPDVAKEAGIEGKEKLTPVVICLGENMLLKGIDAVIEGKDLESFTVTLKAEEAFGKKDPKLLRIIPTEQLKKQGIKPVIGLQLNIDGHYGIIKTTGGGRTVVDFNHPLSSQDITYEIELMEHVEDPEEQIQALLRPLGIVPQITVNGTSATLKTQHALPDTIQETISKKITELTKITTIKFEK